MDGLFLLALAIPIGLFIGWCLGISAWRQVRSLRAEVAALRRALEEAGVAIAATAPQPLPHPTTWATPVPTRGPNPWRTPQPETAAPPPEAEPAAPSTLRRPGMEEALTLRWGIWLGAGALLLAGIFLVRTAVEEGWLGPAERCLLAALLGLALVGGAEWLRRRAAQEDIWLPWSDHAPQALAAGGVAVLFGAAYATAVLYALVPPLVGFALMAAVALAGIALALLQGPVVAAVGILGAFVTPLLVDSPNPFLPGLFGYLLLVTAAALAVLRQVGAGWLGWAAMAGAAIWIVLGGMMAADAAGLWAPALFLPAVAALQLALLPQVAADGVEGRRLTWIPFAVLAAAGLTLLLHADPGLAPGIGLLLLSPVAIAKAAAEPRLNPLPHLAAFAGLLMLLAWPIGAWSAGGEVVTLEGVVLAVLPGAPWPDAALWPFLGLALALALIHAAAGLLLERRAPRPLAWASLTAAVPVLVLLVAYARVRGFALDWGWAVGALGLAAALVGCAALARREGALQRAGVHAAGAVAALALGAAMVLTTSWLTMAVALLLPPLAWIEARAGLPALRRVALAVAAVVLVRLLANPAVLAYGYGAQPVLNGLLLAYGVPALLFALAAFLFRRRGDDLLVAVLEAGAIAFATVLMVLQIRHAATGGAIDDASWRFWEASLQVTGLLALSTALRLADRRLARPMLGWGWRVLACLALPAGVLLILWNPALEPAMAVGTTPVLNALVAAYALPAILAALAARSPESPRLAWLRPVLGAYALAAALAWVTLAVRHAFHPEAMALGLAEIGSAELYAYSGAWLALGALLLALGITARLRALRLAALGLMALTVGKAFLVDMNHLVGLWRVVSFLGLGLALIAVSRVYRRFVVTAPEAP